MLRITVIIFVLLIFFLCLFVQNIRAEEKKDGDFSLEKKDYKMDKRDYKVQFLTVLILVGLAVLLG